MAVRSTLLNKTRTTNYMFDSKLTSSVLTYSLFSHFPNVVFILYYINMEKLIWQLVMGNTLVMLNYYMWQGRFCLMVGG